MDKKALIVTNDDLKIIMKFEENKYYISIGSDLVTQDEKKAVFTKAEAEELLTYMKQAFSDMYRDAKTYEEQQEALDSMVQIALVPLRYH